MADQHSLPRQLSEVEAHQLLARAAELDAKLGARVDVDHLRSAAREAGISEAALTQATAELASGKLGSPARAAALSSLVARPARVAIAAAIVYGLVKNPNFPVAQAVGLSLAVYGAYELLGRVRRWFEKRRALASKHAEQLPAEEPASSNDHMAMLVRLLSASTTARGAA